MDQCILVPLDGSSLGEAALEYLASLHADMYPKTKTTFILFHVIKAFSYEQEKDVPGKFTQYAPYPPEVIEKMKKEYEAYLIGISKEYAQKSGAEVKYEIVVGNDTAEEIIKAESKFKCNFVAMSTHGRSGLSRYAYGSIAEKVLRGGTIPVLLVRANKYGKIK